MNVIFTLRSEEKKAAYRKLRTWKKGHDKLKRLWEVEDMVEAALADRDKDERLFRYSLQRAQGSDKQLIDDTNAFVQDCCDKSIQLHQFINAAIHALHAAGHAVAKADEMTKATQDYERWKEEYPDLLVMGYEPVTKVLRERLTKALNRRPKESNWRKLFKHKESTRNGK